MRSACSRWQTGGRRRRAVTKRRYKISVSAEVSGNSLQISLYRSDALLLALSLSILIVLWVVAGWRIVLVATAASAGGAALIDEVQRWSAASSDTNSEAAR